MDSPPGRGPRLRGPPAAPRSARRSDARLIYTPVGPPLVLESFLEPIYFEELPLGGQWVTRRRTVSESDVHAYIGLAGDYNPLYADVEHARAGPHGGLVAPAALISAMTIGLGAIDVPVPATVALVGMNWKYMLPVRPGDSLRSRWRLNRKREIGEPRWGLAAWQVEVENQRGETVAAAEVVRLVARRRALGGLSGESAESGEAVRTGRRRRRRRGGGQPPAEAPEGEPEPVPAAAQEPAVAGPIPSPAGEGAPGESTAGGGRRRRRRGSGGRPAPESEAAQPGGEPLPPEPAAAAEPVAEAAPAPRRRRRSPRASEAAAEPLPDAPPLEAIPPPAPDPPPFVAEPESGSGLGGVLRRLRRHA